MTTWINDFINFCKSKNYSKQTIRTYISNLHEAKKYIEVLHEDEVITLDLMPYRLHIQNLSKKTIYKKISVIKSFVKYLKDENINIKVLNDENISTSKTLPKPISDEFIQDAISQSSLQDKLLVELFYSLGLRISELENLKIKSIKNSWVIVKGKGDKIRQLPLIDKVEKLIFDYIDESLPKEYLFEKDGKKLSSNQLRYRLTKIFKGLGLKVTPHQLRHSFATELLQAGASIVDVSKLLGHSSLDSTQIYTKLASEYKKSAYQKAHPLSHMESEIV